MKLPIRIVERYDTRTPDLLRRYVVDADDTAFTLEELVAALNATANAPDLTALERAVEAMRAATPGTQAFQIALEDTMDALDALLPEQKDGVP